MYTVDFQNKPLKHSSLAKQQLHSGETARRVSGAERQIPLFIHDRAIIKKRAQLKSSDTLNL